MIKLILLAALMAASALADSSYERTITEWRQKREKSLQADGGWLTVTGLLWLKEGENRAGSDRSNDIVLPRGPGRLGVFELGGERVTFRPADGSAATVLKPDSDDVISQDDLSMFVIHRGERYAIRLKDKQSKFRREFTGLHWYPVKPEYRVVADFVRYEKPKMITIPNILGETEQSPSEGYAAFTLNGHEYRLEPVIEDDQLFFIFRDQTSAKETYGSGRFLYADLPKGGKVILDFNKAYNPPCAFTPYATCPLPPPQNRLAVRIEAGELNYGDHHP
jgi:uncharacterized protein